MAGRLRARLPDRPSRTVRQRVPYIAGVILDGRRRQTAVFLQVRPVFLQDPLNTGHLGRSGGLAFDEAFFLKPACYVRQSDTVAPLGTAALGAMAQECFFMCGRNLIVTRSSTPAATHGTRSPPSPAAFNQSQPAPGQRSIPNAVGISRHSLVQAEPANVVFPMNRACRKRRSRLVVEGPLAPYFEPYAEYLADQGYSQVSYWKKTFLINEFQSVAEPGGHLGRDIVGNLQFSAGLMPARAVE